MTKRQPSEQAVYVRALWQAYGIDVLELIRFDVEHNKTTAMWREYVPQVLYFECY